MSALRSIADCSAPFRGALLRDVRRLDAVREEVKGLLLHAGPPYGDGPVPAPVRNAAAQALIYEGAAHTVPAALHLLESGAYRLAPAQDHGVVTPLAEVVSPSMPVLVVGDGAHQAYAPLAEAPPPALRFGSDDPACLERFRVQARYALEQLGPALRVHPVAMDEVVAAALQSGEECHTLTGVANQALVDRLQGIDDAYRGLLAANGGFVLPAIMAASAWVLARRGLAAVGGNGVAFGMRRPGDAAWRTVPAEAPRGKPLSDALADAPVLGAIGDSAVVDFCGLGGQALRHAPSLLQAWQGLLPDDAAMRGEALCVDGAVDLARAAALRAPPIVHLAMVDAGESGGLVGRGFYLPPAALFSDFSDG